MGGMENHHENSTVNSCAGDHRGSRDWLDILHSPPSVPPQIILITVVALADAPKFSGSLHSRRWCGAQSPSRWGWPGHGSSLPTNSLERENCELTILDCDDTFPTWSRLTSPVTGRVICCHEKGTSPPRFSFQNSQPQTDGEKHRSDPKLGTSVEVPDQHPSDLSRSQRTRKDQQPLQTED